MFTTTLPNDNEVGRATIEGIENPVPFTDTICVFAPVLAFVILVEYVPFEFGENIT